MRQARFRTKKRCKRDKEGKEDDEEKELFSK